MITIKPKRAEMVETIQKWAFNDGHDLTAKQVELYAEFVYMLCAQTDAPQTIDEVLAGMIEDASRYRLMLEFFKTKRTESTTYVIQQHRLGGKQWRDFLENYESRDAGIAELDDIKKQYKWSDTLKWRLIERTVSDIVLEEYVPDKDVVK